MRKKKKGMTIKKSYRDFPEVIIQHIQSFLGGARQGVQSCLLSKSWLQALSTIPTLQFDQSYFSDPRNPIDLQEREFIEMVTNTLVRYREHKLLIESFLLSAQFEQLATFINSWLEIAINSSLKELHLVDMNLAYRPKGHVLKDTFMVLPSSIFSCPMLQTIAVSGCKLEIPAEDHIIKCRSLINLSLSEVHTDYQGIHRLFSNCPLIENLILSYCVGLEEIHFCNLHRLKVLEVSGTRRIKICELDSNSLINLRLLGVVIDEWVCDKLSLNCPLIQGMYLSNSYGVKKIQARNLHCLRELEIVDSRILQEVESDSLRVLKLRMVNIDEQELDQLLNKCPLIEELTLECCIGLKNVKVTNLHCLKRFEISGYRIESVEISAPTLHSFCYNDRNSLAVLHNPCINIASAKYLKVLNLDGLTINGKLFNRLISQFKFLEQLALINCNLERRISLTCDLLTDLRLERCHKFLEVRIHCPKLVHFCFCGNISSPSDTINIRSASTQLETEWTVRNLKFMDTQFLLMLRKVLMKSHRCNFSINCYNSERMDIDLDGLRALSVPVMNLKELTLIFGSSPSEYYSTILNAFFSICHPKYVIVWSLGCPYFDDFGMFFLSELRIKRNTSCCTSHFQDMCWRHYLRDAQLVSQEKFRITRKDDNEGLMLPPALQKKLDLSVGRPLMFHMISCRLEWLA